MIVDILGYREWARALAEIVRADETGRTQVHWHGQFNVLCPDAELTFLVGWSEIVPGEFLRERLVLVLHPSPLPRYRGGSPIQHQIMAGEEVSAVSIFRLDGAHPAVDTGPLAWQQAFSLEGSLADVLGRIATVGARGVADVIAAHHNATLAFIEQVAGETYYRRRTPEQSEITPDELRTLTARQLHDKVRALADPYPNAFIVGADGARLYLTGTHLEQP